MPLIILTHGLGSAEGFWGSTKNALDTYGDSVGHETREWSYTTTKAPITRWLSRCSRLLPSARLQNISEIGQQLWSNLRNWSEGHDDIVLVGHSMGGLVVAAAVVHGVASHEQSDKELMRKMRGLICIASPMNGASSASKLRKVYRLLGKNPHVDGLQPRSAERKEIMSKLTGYALGQERFDLILMRAADDSVVLPSEIEQSLDQHFSVEVLAGGHTDCIRDLDRNSENFAKVTNCIERLTSRTGTGTGAADLQLFDSRSVTIRPEYDRRLRDMQRNLDILAWGLASFRQDYANRFDEWARLGIQVRMLLVDPDSPTGRVLCELQDDVEDRRDGETESDIRNFISEAASRVGSIEVRLSRYHPGVNMFRVDDELFFGPYLAGTVSRNLPTGIVCQAHWLFATLLDHFEWLWERATLPQDN